ncbi:MAG: nucleotidyltransferase domain-containing protein [Dehalococcoidaceae bacterium]|nr:nucleotidyltransferase domain-containing protein [Dehalococcoidaceae bacterium]
MATISKPYPYTLFGKTGYEVLALLFTKPDKSYFLRQIVRLTGCSVGAVQKEIEKLYKAGIITRNIKGNRVFYQANRDIPACKQLRAFILKACTPAPAGIHRLPEFRGASRNIPIPYEQLRAFCVKHHIRKLAFFGSVTRNDFTPKSDIDILVEFEPGNEPGIFELLELEGELSGLLGERKVDLRTPQELSPLFRDEVIRDAETVYAQTK